MADVHQYLLPTERPVVVARRHWAVLVPHASQALGVWLVLVWLLGVTDSGALGLITVSFTLVALLWMTWEVAEWYVAQLAITDKRVILVTGLLWKRVGIMPLIKVTDMTYERSPLGRLLGYGTFVMESAGQDQALSRIEYVGHPDELYRRISTELFGRRMDEPAGVIPRSATRGGTERLPRL